MFNGFITILIGTCLFADHSFAEKKVVGVIEKVIIYPERLLFHGKMDTGARHSSLDAEHMQLFKRNGKDWVKFTVVDRNKKEMTLERPVLRSAKVKQRDGKLQMRPVVALDLCIGRTVKRVEVNLVDRDFFLYPLLIGRSFLRGEFLVDSQKKFKTEPDCSFH
jgi:hypothetical protein